MRVPFGLALSDIEHTGSAELRQPEQVARHRGDHRPCRRAGSREPLPSGGQGLGWRSCLVGKFNL